MWKYRFFGRVVLCRGCCYPLFGGHGNGNKIPTDRGCSEPTNGEISDILGRVTVKHQSTLLRANHPSVLTVGLCSIHADLHVATMRACFRLKPSKKAILTARTRMKAFAAQARGRVGLNRWPLSKHAARSTTPGGSFWGKTRPQSSSTI